MERERGCPARVSGVAVSGVVHSDSCWGAGAAAHGGPHGPGACAFYLDQREETAFPNHRAAQCWGLTVPHAGLRHPTLELAATRAGDGVRPGDVRLMAGLPRRTLRLWL